MRCGKMSFRRLTANCSAARKITGRNGNTGHCRFPYLPAALKETAMERRAFLRTSGGAGGAGAVPHRIPFHETGNNGIAAL